MVDLATGDGLEGIARAQATAEGVGSRWREVVHLVTAALDSELVRQAVGSGRFWREIYVGAPATDTPGGPVVEGIVDLLFETPDGFTVVDYKTDAAGTDEELDAAFGRYELQGATYALAVGRAVGRPVTRCAFLFLREDGAVVREIPDPAAAVERVVAALGDGPGPGGASGLRARAVSGSPPVRWSPGSGGPVGYRPVPSVRGTREGGPALAFAGPSAGAGRKGEA